VTNSVFLLQFNRSRSNSVKSHAAFYFILLFYKVQGPSDRQFFFLLYLFLWLISSICTGNTYLNLRRMFCRGYNQLHHNFNQEKVIGLLMC